MSGHIPVMLNEIVEGVAPGAGDVIVDGTFGAGGYSRALLEKADCRVYGIDRDPDAVARAEAFGAGFGGRFRILEGCFGDMDALVRAAGEEAVDAVVLDIGVSSFQLDEAERGFSFREDGPLDMRMAKSGESAADVVNTYEAGELADLIYKFGEERLSRRIAAAIVAARAEKPFTRTRELADLVERVVGRPPMKAGKKMIHPATRTFQALRIHVNDELGELERGLEGAEKLLAEGGRLVVVTFHSLEDRIVKEFMAERSGRIPAGSRHLPGATVKGPAPTFRLEKKSAVKPTDEECSRNPRSRSAKLRVAIRTAEPARTGRG